MAQLPKEDQPTLRSQDQLATTPYCPNKAQFRLACQALWDSDVRNDLIFGKGLLICKTCLAIFDPKDKDHNHPPADTLKVGAFIKEFYITNEELFISRLWHMAAEIGLSVGLIITPRVSYLHVEVPKKNQPTSLQEQTLLWSQARILELEREVERLQAAHISAMADNRTLKAKQDALFKRMLMDRHLYTNVKERAKDLLRDALALIDSDQEEETDDAK